MFAIEIVRVPTTPWIWIRFGLVILAAVLFFFWMETNFFVRCRMIPQASQTLGSDDE